jgi:hypothetical protein
MNDPGAPGSLLELFIWPEKVQPPTLVKLGLFNADKRLSRVPHSCCTMILSTVSSSTRLML